MVFSSWQFIFLFLPAALLGFLLTPTQPAWMRKTWLLAVSIFFYGCWKVEYVPLLLLSIGCNYAFAEILTRQKTSSPILLGVAVALNLSLLAYYKYTNFVVGFVLGITHHDPVRFDILLPLAISFFTFTQIGYLVDVHRDRALHYRFLDYSLFVAFFPHLIAGPIVRHWEIIPQYSDRKLRPDRSDFCVGLALFLIGLSKKVLLADFVAGYVSDVYGGAEKGLATLTWFDAWLGTLAFALQIYFDFSGYSDMAIGLARLFGIRFPINFDSPYQASSITEFWKRWHVTLTRFLREYVYFPLGGNRCGPGRHMLNVMVTMLLSGLWHGAGLTFLVWGGLHGCFLIIAHRWSVFTDSRGWRLEHPVWRLASVTLTFGAVLSSWVFFKASSLTVAMRVLSTMAGGHGLTMSATYFQSFTQVADRLGVQFVPKSFEADYPSLLIVIGGMLLIAFVLPNSQQLLGACAPALEKSGRPGWWQWTLGLRTGCWLGALFFLVVRTFYTGSPSPFLYFNF